MTGDMTLSILDESGFKVLGVDMLRMNTMRAGDGGELLARTLNDLKLLAQAVNPRNSKHLAIDDPSAQLSPLPWQFEFQESTRRVIVRDADGRMIADRKYPKGTDQETLVHIVQTMAQAVEKVNASQRLLEHTVQEGHTRSPEYWIHDPAVGGEHPHFVDATGGGGGDSGISNDNG